MATEPPHVDVAQALSMLDQRARLLDVREDDEWHAGHAPSAEHRPLGLVDPGDYASGTTIVVVCRSGNRSQKAAIALHGAGVSVYNLDGGMQAWSQAGQPVVRDDGTPGLVA
ncbi:rhodanese-like domain-containing protein [soil metagenome]